MDMRRLLQVFAILVAAAVVGSLFYFFASNSGTSNRNKKVSESLVGYYSSRGGEYSYIQGDYLLLKNITATSMDNMTVVLDVALLSDNPKQLYLSRNAIVMVVRRTIGRTSTMTYRRKVNLDNIKMIIGASVLDISDVSSQIYFENLYYF